MKNKINKYKTIIKNSLINKLRITRQENKLLKQKLLKLTLPEELEKQYISELNKRQREIRNLKLRLSKYE